MLDILYFKLKIFEKYGTSFQSFFSDIMSFFDSGFKSVNGASGDGGNDGYIPSKKHYYQVYAPSSSDITGSITVSSSEYAMNKLEEDVRVEKYLECNPLQEIDKNFSSYVKQIYPKATGGIAITNNDGDNQKRFNLDISLSQDGAEGIAASKLRCFDLVLFLHGHCKETMNMLWHDNRLFAHTSEQIRAKWFQLIIKTLKNYPEKQYIASINEENYDSMMQYLTSEEQKIIKDATVIKFSGDQDSNKLLGITCG